MRAGSLFSGIGGFDLGFKRAGMEVAWQCEIDKQARAVLARHWPGVPCYDDVTKLRGADLSRVDVLCGGFPCQDISVAGKRAGLAGERSGLWFEFARIAGELKPQWVVIENVPGLRSSNGGLDLATILRGLAELGYMGAWWSPDAQYFGLAQRRERVFIVGHLGSGRAVEVLPDTASLCGHPAPSREAGEGIAGTLGGSSQSGGFRTTDLDNNGAYVTLGTSHGVDNLAVAPTLSGNPRNRSYPGSDPIVFVAPVYAIQDGREMEKAQNGLGVSESVAYTLDGTGAQAVGYVPEFVPNAMSSKWAKGAGGPAGDEVQNLVAPQSMVRRLTPTECERLQGFPDGWTAGQADSHRYKQLGNAVAVPVAEWIGRQLMAVIKR